MTAFLLSHHEHRTANYSWRRTLEGVRCVYVCIYLCLYVYTYKYIYLCLLWQKWVNGTRWMLAEEIFYKGINTVYAQQSTGCHVNTQTWWMLTVLRTSSCTSVTEWRISFVLQLTGKLGPLGPGLYLRKIYHARKFAKNSHHIFCLEYRQECSCLEMCQLIKSHF